MAATLKSRRPEVPTIIAYEVTSTGERHLSPIATRESYLRTFFRTAAASGRTRPLYLIRITRWRPRRA